MAIGLNQMEWDEMRWVGMCLVLGQIALVQKCTVCCVCVRCVFANIKYIIERNELKLNAANTQCIHLNVHAKRH